MSFNTFLSKDSKQSKVSDLGKGNLLLIREKLRASITLNRSEIGPCQEMPLIFITAQQRPGSCWLWCAFSMLSGWPTLLIWGQLALCRCHRTLFFLFFFFSFLFSLYPTPSRVCLSNDSEWKKNSALKPHAGMCFVCIK